LQSTDTQGVCASDLIPRLHRQDIGLRARKMSNREILIDVSRLVWRFWRGRVATGVDRVCLAYVEHFAGRAQAVIQRRGHYFILRPDHSDELFGLFLEPTNFRRHFLRLAVRAIPASRRRPEIGGSIYLNVGHTGLDEQSLVSWIKDNGLRAIFLIHDLIPLLHPEYCRAGERAKHERRMRNVLISAHGLIANSQATIDDVATFAKGEGLPIPPSLAAWIASSPIPKNTSARTFDRSHFIVVGTIEARKNHVLLLHIWRRLIKKLGRSTPLLIIVGQRGWEANQAIAMLDRSNDLADHVRELGTCDDDELARLIVGARALLMPSFTEGFGLPVAEALELGTPVIASDLPVFREFADEIPTYLDPLDGTTWEHTIMSFTGESAERDRQLRAISGYRPPNWRHHFEMVETWLHGLSKHPSSPART
jgi:glycosyltransferase involved in cell wall biosynthesis